MMNADLDESIYDSMLHQHIVDGGIEELFISYDADGSGALTALPALCKGGKLRTLAPLCRGSW